jgi:putative flippase GtrA
MTYILTANRYRSTTNYMILNNELLRFTTFASIGLFNVFFDTGIYTLLLKLISKDESFINKLTSLKLTPYTFSHTVSFIIASISSYILNKTFTWSDSTKQYNTQFLNFFLVALTSYIISFFIVQLLTQKKYINLFQEKLPQISNYYPIVVKLIAIVGSVFINYFGYKYFVF